MSIFSKGINALGSLVGLGGGQGEYYRSGRLENEGTESLKALLDARNSGAVSGARGKLLDGLPLREALSGLSADELANLGTGAVSGSMLAQQQVLEDPTLAGLFGKGGQLNQATDEATRLASQGYKLQPEDYEAYGQASGDIARMFGQQEQSLASALANRGLAAGGSGTGAAQFSGLMGNKYEQLAKLQTNIANQRMQNTMQRLQQTHSYINQLAGTGQDAVGRAFGRNQQAYSNTQSTAGKLADATRDDYIEQQRADMASMQSKLDNKELGLADAVQGGLFTGVQAGTSAGVGAFTGNALGGKDYTPSPATPAKPKTLDSTYTTPKGLGYGSIA